MNLSPVYHWSPCEVRGSIRRRGLVPGSPPTISTGESTEEPMICFGPTPLGAWELSGGMPGAAFREWDLWQVSLEVEDAVYVLPQWGPAVREIRAANRIPADRVVWLGTRTNW